MGQKGIVVGSMHDPLNLVTSDDLIYLTLFNPSLFLYAQFFN